MLHKHLDIQFVYKEGQKAEDSDALTPEALAMLPAEWLETLKQGALRADLQLLSSIINRIREHNAQLAETLARLLEDFEYGENSSPHSTNRERRYDCQKTCLNINMMRRTSI